MVDVWRRMVQFGFRLLYNELAFTYDWVSQIVSLGSWRCWQRTALLHLPVPDGGLVLELAHGTGSLQAEMLQKGYNTVGFDLSPYMGSIATAKLDRAGLPANLVRGDAAALPFPNETYLAVICTFPTAFIATPEVLREVHRVLQQNGQFIIVPGAVFTGGGLAARGLEWLYRVTGQREDTPFEIADFFEGFGFAVRTVQETCPHSRVTLILAHKKGTGIH